MNAYYKSQVIVGSGGLSGEIYSTEETRIGTWIDGKPLYRKVLTLNYPSSNGTFDLFYVNNLNIDQCTKYIGYIRINNETQFIPYYHSASNQGSLWVSGETLKLNKEGNYYNGHPFVIALEYTKTTDAATQTPAFAQSAQSLQVDAFGIAPVPAAASAAAEISEEVQ